MNTVIVQFRPGLEKVLEHLKKEAASFRIGRATPSLVENVLVDAYETPTPIMHLANINTPDPKTITIQPWDKNLLKAIEKGLQKADLGINPTVQGDIILLTIPALTEESRKEIVKKLHQRLEDAKVTLKGQREKAREEIMQMEKDKSVSEDEKFKLLDELEELIKEYNEKVKNFGLEKEEEIMKI